MRPVWSAVISASARLTGVRSLRPECRTPLRSVTARSLIPASSRILATATPAAPAPEMTTRVDSGLRPVSLSALVSAASATTAVPCWSSWKTGMSSIALSRSSISKQRGAEMSSRLMPPKLGASRTTVSMISSTSVVARQIGTRVDAAELLEQHRLALHHRHRGGRPDVAEAEHGGAVGDDGDRVGHPGVVPGHRGIRGDRLADPGDARACRPARGRPGRSARPSSGPPSCRRRAGRRPGLRPWGGPRRSLPQTPVESGMPRTAAQRPDPEPDHGEHVLRRAPTPRCRESTPSSGSSLSSHHPGPPLRVVRRSAARFTATVPSASRATTTSPGRVAAPVVDQQAGRPAAGRGASSPRDHARTPIGACHRRVRVRRTHAE